MPDTDIRKALRALNRSGVPWDEIAMRINLLAQGQRVVTAPTLRRFALDGAEARRATVYWIARYLDEALASALASRRSAVSRAAKRGRELRDG